MSSRAPKRKAALAVLSKAESLKSKLKRVKKKDEGEVFGLESKSNSTKKTPPARKKNCKKKEVVNDQSQNGLQKRHRETSYFAEESFAGNLIGNETKVLLRCSPVSRNNKKKKMSTTEQAQVNSSANFGQGFQRNGKSIGKLPLSSQSKTPKAGDKGNCIKYIYIYIDVSCFNILQLMLSPGASTKIFVYPVKCILQKLTFCSVMVAMVNFT